MVSIYTIYSICNQISYYTDHKGHYSLSHSIGIFTLPCLASAGCHGPPYATGRPATGGALASCYSIHRGGMRSARRLGGATLSDSGFSGASRGTPTAVLKERKRGWDWGGGVIDPELLLFHSIFIRIYWIIVDFLSHRHHRRIARLAYGRSSVRGPSVFPSKSFPCCGRKWWETT